MEPLTPNILALMYFGDAVFAMSGALAAGRHRMGPPGEFIRIGPRDRASDTPKD